MYFTLHAGFSLLEVLVSLLLLAIMLFGLDVLEVTTLQNARNTYYFHIAVNQMQNLSAYLATSNISLAEINNAWNAENKVVLPAGHGTVTGVAPNYRAQLFWGNATTHICNNREKTCLTTEFHSMV